MSRFMRRGSVVLLGALLLGSLLGACAKAEPGDAVEAYLKALMAQDEDGLFKTVCPEWEAQAGVDLAAFSGVTGRLDGVSCNTTGREGNVTLVMCAGKMVLNYNGEERERSLTNTTYLAQKVDGEWKMCGYR